MPPSTGPSSRDHAILMLREIQAIRDLLDDMGGVHHEDELLQLVARRIAGLDEVAIARIWLALPGDRCAGCELREGCPSQEACLHAVASQGRSIVDESATWSALSGTFSRIPISPARRIAKIYLSDAPLTIPDFSKEPAWLEDEEWQRLPGTEEFRKFVEDEKIVGFLGCPLSRQGKSLGVIGVYTRRPVFEEEGPIWLRVVASHLTSGIVAARALDQIKELNQKLAEENEYLRREVRNVHALGEMIGESPAIQKVARQVEMVAPTDATVLITGQTGTGKELVAREIHACSARKDQPMVRVNCASVPRELYESEFFGHVKGAFTGAVKDRAGRFELASGGTLFLDEVGEIPLELQSKLLRALQEGQYERVGEDKTREVDVRVVAATNRDLQQEVAAGRFREDLYYRLAVFPIEIAPLRDREQDIRLLAEHFIERACQRWNRPVQPLTLANVNVLCGYSWPGNVRELQNVVERALITSPGSKLVFDLPQGDEAGEQTAPPPTERDEERILTEAEIRRSERDNLVRALDRTSWKVYGDDGAAGLLGIKPTTLASRIKKLGLEPPR